MRRSRAARKRESTDAPHGRRLDRNRLFKRRDTRSVRAAKARRWSHSHAHAAEAAVTVDDLRRAVITSEILSKPVSLRDE